ncbi:MAG: PorT family protein [Cytophagaceae bacterium]|nr:PorT family protein [Cytophagaceae bacterium]
MMLSKFRIIALFTILFCVSIHAKSQNVIEGYWGAKAGLNVNKISKLTFDNSFKPGFHLGVFAVFRLNDHFSIQHEVLYSMRGVTLDLPAGGGTYAKNFSFIDLPWMLNYHFSENFNISAGVQTSVYAYFKKPVADTIVYNKDNVNTIDFSYFVGGSFLLDNNFGFGVRFNGGIVPAFDVNETKGKNYTLQIFLMYAINKRKGKTF